MEKEIKTFTGIFYASDKIDLITMLKLKKPDFLYIIGMMTSMMGFMMEGFEAFSMTGMNLYPEMMKELYEHLKEFRMREALMLKDKMTKHIIDMFRMDMEFYMDFVTLMKMEMDKLFTTMRMGPVRKPKMTMNRMMFGKMMM